MYVCLPACLYDGMAWYWHWHLHLHVHLHLHACMDRDVIYLSMYVLMCLFTGLGECCSSLWFYLFGGPIELLNRSKRMNIWDLSNKTIGSSVEFIICNNGRSKEKNPAKRQTSWDWGLNQPAVGCICVHTYVQYRKLGLEIWKSIGSSERMCAARSGSGKGLTPPPKKEKQWTSAHQRPATSLLKILSRYLKPSQSHDDSGELLAGICFFALTGTWAKYNKS